MNKNDLTIAEKIKAAKIVLLTDYRGINVADVTELRKKLREANGSYSVIKNNIIIDYETYIIIIRLNC